jgi:hypothetical protein
MLKDLADVRFNRIKPSGIWLGNPPSAIRIANLTTYLERLFRSRSLTAARKRLPKSLVASVVLN